jgi:ribonuclease P protein component
MISRAHRFHGYGSLRYVYQHGRMVRSPLMSLRFSTNEKRKNYRLAVVVSKKVDKSAVARNRMRRRLYEIVRTNPPTGGLDLVLTVFNASVAELPAPELQKQVTGLLRGIIEQKEPLKESNV